MSWPQRRFARDAGSRWFKEYAPPLQQAEPRWLTYAPLALFIVTLIEAAVALGLLFSHLRNTPVGADWAFLLIIGVFSVFLLIDLTQRAYDLT